MSFTETVVHQFLLVANNDPRLSRLLRDHTYTAILTAPSYGGDTVQAYDAYAEAYRNGDIGYWAEIVGYKLADVVGTWIEEIKASISPSQGELTVVLDALVAPFMIGTDEVQRHLGAHLLPFPADDLREFANNL